MKCPKCGYTDEPLVTLVSNEFSEYVYQKDGKPAGLINGKVESHTFKDGAVVIRKDLWKPAVVVPITESKEQHIAPTKIGVLGNVSTPPVGVNVTK